MFITTGEIKMRLYEKLQSLDIDQFTKVTHKQDREKNTIIIVPLIYYWRWYTRNTNMSHKNTGFCTFTQIAIIIIMMNEIYPNNNNSWKEKL